MAEPLKDMFFKPEFFDDLAAVFKAVYPAFEAETFLARIYDEGWEDRALKERVRHTTLTLGGLLPEDYRTALSRLRQVAPALDSYGFEKMIFPDFVEVYGLDDWDASLPALEQFTQQASAEFAVRPFIVKDQERMMAQMLEWTQHESHQVRRLASEGCRPRLPWVIALPALKADPSPILPILEQLKLDESESVRRSVANNLNDISKDNPGVVVDLLREWQTHDTEEMRWITSHALRTLVKAGDPDALELLGYPSQPAILVKNLVVEPDTIAIGENVTFSFEVESTGGSPQYLMIDYVVHLMRAKGKQTPKVFKLTKRTLAPGERLHITKQHSFAPVTTRKYYAGEHAVEIQINGTSFGRGEFIVMDADAFTPTS
jgi:3-methyladenine DNA glycosylase AlkC